MTGRRSSSRREKEDKKDSRSDSKHSKSEKKHRTSSTSRDKPDRGSQSSAVDKSSRYDPSKSRGSGSGKSKAPESRSADANSSLEKISSSHQHLMDPEIHKKIYATSLEVVKENMLVNMLNKKLGVLDRAIKVDEKALRHPASGEDGEWTRQSTLSHIEYEMRQNLRSLKALSQTLATAKHDRMKHMSSMRAAVTYKTSKTSGTAYLSVPADLGTAMFFADRHNEPLRILEKDHVAEIAMLGAKGEARLAEIAQKNEQWQISDPDNYDYEQIKQAHEEEIQDCSVRVSRVTDMYNLLTSKEWARGYKFAPSSRWLPFDPPSKIQAGVSSSPLSLWPDSLESESKFGWYGVARKHAISSTDKVYAYLRNTDTLPPPIISRAPIDHMLEAPSPATDDSDSDTESQRRRGKEKTVEYDDDEENAMELVLYSSNDPVYAQLGELPDAPPADSDDDED